VSAALCSICSYMFAGYAELGVWRVRDICC
jgi:hypothetical protein